MSGLFLSISLGMIHFTAAMQSYAHKTHYWKFPVQGFVEQQFQEDSKFIFPNGFLWHHKKVGLVTLTQQGRELVSHQTTFEVRWWIT